MTKFCVNCEELVSASQQLNSMKTDILNINLNNININDPEFDFAGAIQAIKNNIKNIATKLENAANLLNEVVNQHTTVQTRAIPEFTDVNSFANSSAANEDFTTFINSTNTQTYEVKDGDTLWDIAIRYGVTVTDLYNANKNLITDPNLIYSGWNLVIPNGNTVINNNVEDEFVSGKYTVKDGDTLEKIAQKFNTTVEAILLANQGLIVNPNLIYSGWKLTIPDGTEASSKPEGENNVKPNTSPTFTSNPENYGDDNFTVEIPENIDTTTTTYMGWHTVTSVSSNQYKLRETAMANNDVSLTDEGFYLINDGNVDRVVVATTQKYGNVGDCIDVTLKDGTVLNCIIGDVKSSGDSHFNEYGHMFGDTINVIEYITDWRGGHSNPSMLGEINLRVGVNSVTNTGNSYF